MPSKNPGGRAGPTGLRPRRTVLVFDVFEVGSVRDVNDRPPSTDEGDAPTTPPPPDVLERRHSSFNGPTVIHEGR